MDSRSADSSPPHTSKPTDDNPTEDSVPKEQDNSARDTPSMLSTSSLTSWAQNLKLPETGATTKSAFSRMASGISMSFNSRASSQNETASDNSETSQSGVFESITKGLVDTSLGAVKAVQVKARHLVSQNKRRYQEGGFDLDMTYITENILAMGFPAGDMSSGLFGYFEGLYRNHMEEVIKFFETHHKGKYKVYNLCSERLYDASLFEGKVATFPFDDHNCPPLQLIKLFCVSAYSWLKEDILNVVVVHCKAGMARTGLMICSLLLYLKFFPTAEECINYYNPKRCIDGKGLILPSQIRYVKYFERVLTQFNGETPAGRRCMLRGFRLHKCPYWVRPSITISNHNGILFTTKKHPKTKDLMAEDFWIRAPKKGIVVFALPGEPGLTEVIGDFKIHFHDRQGDFYCWLNTSMMENRMILSGNEFEDFDKRKLPSPGFEVEIVMVDYDGTKKSIEKTNANKPNPDQSKVSTTKNTDDDVFSDSDEEESTKSKSVIAQTSSDVIPDGSSNNKTVDQNSTLSHQSQTTTTQLPIDTNNEVKNEGMKKTPSIPNLASGDIKAMAADASVFTFGDDEDYETE